MISHFKCSTNNFNLGLIHPRLLQELKNCSKVIPSLILGFNTFLPPGYTIDSSELEAEEKELEQQKSDDKTDEVLADRPKTATIVDFDRARSYVMKIKNRFANQPEVYKQFLDILQNYHNQKHTIPEVLEQVSVLFKGHEDLIEEFKIFPPEPSTPNKTAESAVSTE